MSGQRPAAPYPPKAFPSPWWSGNSPGTGAMASRAGIHSCLSREGGNWAHLAQQPTAASSFAGYMFVFKFLRPSSLPPLSPPGPWPAFASFLPSLDQAGLQGGAQAKPLSPAAHQPSADRLGSPRDWGDKMGDSGASPGPLPGVGQGHVPAPPGTVERNPRLAARTLQGWVSWVGKP